jgi:hypothetical protein
MPNHPLGVFAAATYIVKSASERDPRRSDSSSISAAARRGRMRQAAIRIFGGRPTQSEPDRGYLAEHYLKDIDAERVDAHARRLAAAAEGARRAGLHVRLISSAGLPGDDTLLSLFSAPSAAEVERTIELAEVAVDRIVPVLWRAGDRETKSRDKAKSGSQVTEE